MSKKLLFGLVVLMTAMMCALGARAQEAYACYTADNTTLTFYYDDDCNIRPGTTYFLNTDNNDAGWDTDGTKANVTRVVFDPSFADARPTTTYGWFYGMTNLQSVEGLTYLNTSEVTIMAFMFDSCYKLTSLDLSSFNTSQVYEIRHMFIDCNNLRTIYVGDGWTTASMRYTWDMFKNCTSLVGGKGTAYDVNHVDKDYARIDGGPSNPGYFTEKPAFTRGDVDGDGDVSISDVSKLTDYLLTGNASGVNLWGADADQDGEVAIADVSAIIDYLLNGTW